MKKVAMTLFVLLFLCTAAHAAMWSYDMTVNGLIVGDDWPNNIIDAEHFEYYGEITLDFGELYREINPSNSNIRVFVPEYYVDFPEDNRIAGNGEIWDDIFWQTDTFCYDILAPNFGLGRFFGKVFDYNAVDSYPGFYSFIINPYYNFSISAEGGPEAWRINNFFGIEYAVINLVFSNGTQIVSVPEPNTVIFLVFGTLLLILINRYRQTTAG